MPSGKSMTAVVSIGGAIDPSLQRSISAAQNSVNGLGVKLGKIGSFTFKASIAGAVALGAGIAAVGTAAAAAVNELYELGSEFDEAVDNIRIGTGKTGQDLGRLNKSFEKIYANAIQGKKEVSSVVADLNTLTGMEGKLLEDSAERILKSSQMLGIESKNIVDSSARAINAFGVSSSKLPDVLDYTFKVAQETGAGMDELFKTVHENSSALKTLGYGLEPAIALMGQMHKGGLESSKVMMAMNTAARNLQKKGYKDFGTGLSQVYEAIKKAKNETKAFEIASEIFGARGAAAITKGVREGVIGTRKLQNSMEASSETVLTCYDDIADFPDNMTILWHNIEVSLRPLADKIYDSLNRMFPAIERTVNKILPLVKSGVEKLLPYVERAIQSIEQWINGINIDAIVAKAQHAVNQFGEAVKTAFGWFQQNGPWLLKMLKKIGTAFLIYKTAVVTLTGLYKAYKLITSVTKIWTVAQAALNVALTANPVGLVIAAIAALIAIGYVLWDNWDVICQWFGETWEWLKAGFNVMCEVLSVAWDHTCDAISDAWDACGEWLSSVWDSICDSLNAAWTAFSIALQAAWDGICKALKDVWNGLVSWFKTGIQVWVMIGNKIGQALKDAFTSVRDWVMQIVDSILAKFTSLFDGIKNAGNKVKGWFGFGGNDSSPLPAKAAGGFTSGLSLCGEAGPEAVISFDPRYRAENRGYLMTAADMLGMDLSAGSSSRQSVVSYHLGGVTFAPVIKAGAGTTPQDIVRQLKDALPDLLDMIQDGLAERSVGKYA